jgi:hypothetical protein
VSLTAVLLRAIWGVISVPELPTQFDIGLRRLKLSNAPNERSTWRYPTPASRSNRLCAPISHQAGCTQRNCWALLGIERCRHVKDPIGAASMDRADAYGRQGVSLIRATSAISPLCSDGICTASAATRRPLSVNPSNVRTDSDEPSSHQTTTRIAECRQAGRQAQVAVRRVSHARCPAWARVATSCR